MPTDRESGRVGAPARPAAASSDGSWWRCIRAGRRCAPWSTASRRTTLARLRDRWRGVSSHH